MDQLFREYRVKVKQQRQNGQIVSDLEDILNEDVLALYSWQGVVAQIPGTLTGLGILGTFIGLLRGLRNINFVTVEAALSSVQSILTGIDTAFYTSIAGVILSILLIYLIISSVIQWIVKWGSFWKFSQSGPSYYSGTGTLPFPQRDKTDHGSVGPSAKER